MQAHVSHITKRHSQATWDFACLRAKQVKTYVDIYYSHLTKPETLGTEKQVRIILSLRPSFQSVLLRVSTIARGNFLWQCSQSYGRPFILVP